MGKMNPVMIAGVLLALVIVVIVTALLVPQQTNPAYASAVDFVKAAGSGDDAEAMSHLSDTLVAYVAENCRDGSVSACVDDYTPAEWGSFLNAVFRRAQPDGPNAWDILLLGTWEEGQGFSGVCIYTRAERPDTSSDAWEIVRWSGFVSCDLPNAGLSGLAQDDAPNRAP
ncbi:hypothetical protein G4Y79_00630 [Phototrophicus methaneseepsis]|uniref:Uncharacterized protein n=1 Tax=Phototrophicus methaneseepsis TaxID=2710758 RepID=A0A7S8E9N3_9CHLR|nr:hypothetical protein [Phototrophicus methaneseepsis]QPC82910.1 hypothetical protein G4Y79_00630 [Phototrophicus methaneseepsis]